MRGGYAFRARRSRAVITGCWSCANSNLTGNFRLSRFSSARAGWEASMRTQSFSVVMRIAPRRAALVSSSPASASEKS